MEDESRRIQHSPSFPLIFAITTKDNNRKRAYSAMKLDYCANVMQGAQNATLSMLITSRRAESTRTRGFVWGGKSGKRLCRRCRGCASGISPDNSRRRLFFHWNHGTKGERNEVNRKESPGRKPCPAAFPSRGITIDSRTIVREEKKLPAEKPIQSNSLEEMVLENFSRQRTTYCSF